MKQNNSKTVLFQLWSPQDRVQSYDVSNAAFVLHLFCAPVLPWQAKDVPWTNEQMKVATLAAEWYCITVLGIMKISATFLTYLYEICDIFKSTWNCVRDRICLFSLCSEICEFMRQASVPVWHRDKTDSCWRKYSVVSCTVVAVPIAPKM